MENKPQSSSEREVTPEMLGKWLDVQAQGISLQKEKMDLERREIDHDNALAVRSLDLQAADRREERIHHAGLVRLIALTGLGVLLIMVVFAGVMAFMNKEPVLQQLMQFTTEVAKIALGGVVGYCFAVIRQRKNNSDNSEE